MKAMRIIVLLLLIVVFLLDYTSCDAAISRGPLIWQEEFDGLNLTLWNHWVTAWHSTPSEFQYYHNSRNNRLTII